MKQGGVGLLDGAAKVEAETLLSGLAESWLKHRGAGAHGNEWLSNIFERMGTDPDSAGYVTTSNDDVWAFVEGLRHGSRTRCVKECRREANLGLPNGRLERLLTLLGPRRWHREECPNKDERITTWLVLSRRSVLVIPHHLDAGFQRGRGCCRRNKAPPCNARRACAVWPPSPSASCVSA